MLPFQKKLIYKGLIFTLFCLYIYFPLFLHLGVGPARLWDESLFAMRAGLMAEEGKYLLNYSYWVEGGSGHKNTKPPLMTWVQAGFIKVFGHSELVLRLPIALLATGAIFLMVWFFKKEWGSIGFHI